MRRILVSEAAFSLAMILLFACLFTTMTSFQPTFAGERGLDYSVFYVAYTVAVIFPASCSRGAAARFDSRLVIAASVSVMALRSRRFSRWVQHPLLPDLLSPIGSGLRAAAKRAGAGGQRLGGAGRPRVLADGGHALEGAILGFPLVAGWVITGFGYRALFAVLLAFALVQVTIAWWRFLVAGRSKGTQEL